MAVSILKGVRSQLKEWEHTFIKLHGRPPCKDDINDSPSIHSLYREYADLKRRLQMESTDKVRVIAEVVNSQANARDRGRHSESDEGYLCQSVTSQLDAKVPLEMAAKPISPAHSSHSYESRGTEISATPPKHNSRPLGSSPLKTFKNSDPSNKISPIVNANASAGQSKKPVLSLIDTNVQSSRNNVPLTIPASKKAPVRRRQLKKQIMVHDMSEQDNVGNENLPQSSCLGFTIKKQRVGEPTKSSERDAENYPAGYFTNCASTCKAGVARLSRRVMAKDQHSQLDSTDEVAEYCISGKSSSVRDFEHAPFHYDGIAVSRQPGQSLFSGFDSSDTLTNCVDNPSSESNELPRPGNRDLGVDKLLDKCDADSLWNLTVPTLKEMLLALGISYSGEKSALIARLTCALYATKGGGFLESYKASQKEVHVSEHSNVSIGDANNMPKDLSQVIDAKAASLRKMTVASLKKMLSAQGLLVSGNKTALIERILSSRVDTNNDSKLKKGSNEANGFSLRNRNGKDMGDKDRLLTCKSQNVLNSVDSRKDAFFKDIEKGDTLPMGTLTCISRRKKNLRHSTASGEDSAGQVKRRRVLGETKDVKLEQHGLENSAFLEESHLFGKSLTNAKFLKKAIGRKRSLNSTADHIRNRSAKISVSRHEKGIMRENFVKLKINGRGGGRNRFSNRMHRRTLGGYRWRYNHGSNGKRQKGIITNVEQDNGSGTIECQDVGEDGNTLHILEDVGNVSSKKLPSCKNAMDQHVQVERFLPGAGEIDSATSSISVKEIVARTLSDPSERNLLEVLHIVFGFQFFRPGQVEAIQRLVAQQSTMLVLGTGSGKSLCYQLPAFLLPGVTLVISPLTALMVDQFHHLPPLVPGAILSCNQTFKEVDSTMDRLRSGELKVLFVSPERFLSDIFITLLQGLPSISMAVVDEAHCLSEWSHNFRPSYFRLGGILRQRLKVQCVLAMTATVTNRTLDSILHSLSIPSTGVIRVVHSQNNLHLSVSLSENRFKDLLSLLLSSPFSEAQSIIIYCKFQSGANNVCKFLCDNMIQAKSYHGGMSTSDRILTHELFCSDKLRVVVATVAFGLGLDKSNVRAVIHFDLPSTLENYVQETGRAGRDGEPAYCHLFLDHRMYLKLRSLAYSDGVDENAVKRFLLKVFDGCSGYVGTTYLKSLFIESTSRNLDLKEQVMATILSHLEVGEVQYVEVLPQMKATCILRFHKSSPMDLAKENSLLSTIIRRSQVKNGQYIFDLPSLANNFDISLSLIHQLLQRLKIEGQVSYELKDPAYCFRVLKVPEDLSTYASELSAQFSEMDAVKVKKLDYMYVAASAAAVHPLGVQVHDVTNWSFQEMINNYFHCDERELFCGDTPSIVKHSSPFLKADIKVFLQTNSQITFTGRAIARIFHGLGSPAYPSSTWSKNYFWGRYINVDFNAIKEAAVIEINVFCGVSSKI